MAMYIKIEIGGEPVAIYSVQRQEDLEGEDKVYTYVANKYDQLDSGFARSKENIRIVHHKYSDKAEVLAEKVLKAFNH